MDSWLKIGLRARYDILEIHLFISLLQYLLLVLLIRSLEFIQLLVLSPSLLGNNPTGLFFSLEFIQIMVLSPRLLIPHPTGLFR